MIIYNLCPNCKAQVSIKSSANTPQDLLQSKGETMSLTCDSCQSTFLSESMQTRAKISMLKVSLGIVASLVFGAMIWDVGYIALISIAPAIIMYRVEEGSVSAYNRLSKRKYG